MGMSPQTAEMIALLGSSVLGNVTAPQGQRLQSFEGSTMDPEDMLGQSKGLISGFLQQTQDRAQAGTHLDTTVNPLPTFTGKGLPMTVGAPGMDERRIPRRTLAPPTSSGVVRGPRTTPPNEDGSPGRIMQPQTPTSRMDPQGAAGGDDQALAAFELLKKAGLQF